MAVLKPTNETMVGSTETMVGSTVSATSSSGSGSHPSGDFSHQHPSKEFSEDDAQSVDSSVSGASDESERLVSCTLDSLKEYMEMLPDAPFILNRRLDAQHNYNQIKAKELFEYYQDREWLADYSIETELKRMDYAWVDPSTGAYIQNKARIASFLREASQDPELCLLPRIANQSLLGDLLRILMTDEASKPGHQIAAEPSQNNRHARFSLIDSAFASFNKTKHVNFIVMPSSGSVLAKASLEICLPHPDMDYLRVGTVQVSAQFSPHEGLYQYRVECIQIDKVPDSELLKTACFLHDVPCPEEGSQRSSKNLALDMLGGALWQGAQIVDGLMNKMGPQAA